MCASAAGAVYPRLRTRTDVTGERMKTVLVASSKGGAGKTTIATHLAAHAALEGRRTALVDADPQQSSTRWAERRAELESAVLPVAGARRAKAAWKSLPEDTQRVVVSCHGGLMLFQGRNSLVYRLIVHSYHLSFLLVTISHPKRFVNP